MKKAQNEAGKGGWVKKQAKKANTNTNTHATKKKQKKIKITEEPKPGPGTIESGRAQAVEILL